MRRMFLIAAAAFLFVATAIGQVLVTGTTGGKDNGSVAVFGTGQRMDGAYSANNWGLLSYGATNHLDVYVGAGDMVARGTHVPYATVQGGTSLPTAEKLHFDVGIFESASFPVAHRELASTAFLVTAIVGSKTLKRQPDGFPVTLYSGYVWNYSFGPQDRFMAMPVVRQIPFGVSMPLGGKKSPAFIAAEYDYGRMQSVGLAIGRTFAWRHSK